MTTEPGKIRAVIVDDEPLAREAVRTLVADDTDIMIVGEASNGVDAVALVRQESPDLLFLDVQMPDLGGFGGSRLFPNMPVSPQGRYIELFDADNRHRRPAEVPAAERHLAFQFIMDTRHGTFSNIGMHCKDFFDRTGRQPVSGNIYHVIGTAHNLQITVRIDKPRIACLVITRKLIQVGLTKPFHT